MKNSLQDAIDLMFETAERLRDPDDPMDAKTANAMANIGGKLVDFAKVELKFIEVVGQEPTSDFFRQKPQLPAYNGNGALTHDSEKRQ
jgi:hypothetical protein